MRLLSPSFRTRRRGSVNAYLLAIASLTAVTYYQYHQFVYTDIVVFDNGKPPVANMLVSPQRISGLERFRAKFGWPIVKASTVTIPFDRGFSVVPAVMSQVRMHQRTDVANAQIGLLTTDGLVMEGGDSEVADAPDVGDVFVYSERDQGRGADVGETSDDHAFDRPVLKLDEYMQPGPGRFIYTDTVQLKNASHSETAVFIVKPGSSLTLTGCSFPGGVIVVVRKPDVPTPDSQCNVYLKMGTKIGGGDQGASRNIGLIAPECELFYSYAGSAYAGQTDIEGFTVVKTMRNAHQICMKGMALTFDTATQKWDSIIECDPVVSANLPDGVTYRRSQY